MEEKENQAVPAAQEQKAEETPAEPKRDVKGWFIDFAKGVGIGLSMNVPGASGGTTALLEGIYDRFVGAVSDIFRKFKASFIYLLPIGLGIIIGLVATLVPMKYALATIPFGISCLFAGLVVAGLPTLSKNVWKKPTAAGLISFILSCALVVGLNFIPGLGNFNLDAVFFPTLLLAFAMGVIGSFALVIPGVSGALLLFIFGFYTPILGSLNDIVKGQAHLGADFAYVIIFIVGMVVGFIASSKAMKYLLHKHPYETYMGIIGFVLGSIYAIYHPFIVGSDTMGKFANGLFPTSTLSLGGHIGLGAALFVVSCLAFYFLFRWSDKKNAEKLKKEER
jgi:putative membrane protein